VAVLVAEFEAVKPVGVAGDVESAPMMHSMMFPAHKQQVVGVGAAAVFPMDQVVHFEAERGVTARNPTHAMITMLNDGAGAGGYDVLGTPNRHRQAVVEKHWGERAVTGEVAADRVGHIPAGGVGHVARVSVGVDEQVDPEP